MKRLTIRQLRSLPGYETVSDSEAENIIDTLVQLSLVFISLYSEKKQEMEQELEKSHTTIKD